MTSRTTRTIAAGIAIVAFYAATAWLSGQLSPLARRPLLDGLAPPTPYRWVDPPPELASTNLAPAPGTFRVELGTRGSLTAVLTTTDAQVTLILPKGSFAPAEGERAIHDIESGAWPFTGEWHEWRPDPSWPAPALPEKSEE